MSKARRFLILILCAALLGICTAANADQVTVGILLTGMVPAEDGTYRSVTLEGDFRIYQNGREIGTIAAGRETLTLNSLERVRIEPVPQSFAPGWDLSTAGLTTELTGTGSQMISVKVWQKKDAAAAAAESTAAPVIPETAGNTENTENTETGEIPEDTSEPKRRCRRRSCPDRSRRPPFRLILPP